eukprot:m.86270 g.86270  ORF g.86270 m.86270 type:complete len:964 (+) comp13050_c0_seq1:299-3190(+)
MEESTSHTIVRLAATTCDTLSTGFKVLETFLGVAGISQSFTLLGKCCKAYESVLDANIMNDALVERVYLVGMVLTPVLVDLKDDSKVSPESRQTLSRILKKFKKVVERSCGFIEKFKETSTWKKLFEENKKKLEGLNASLSEFILLLGAWAPLNNFATLAQTNEMVKRIAQSLSLDTPVDKIVLEGLRGLYSSADYMASGRGTNIFEHFVHMKVTQSWSKYPVLETVLAPTSDLFTTIVVGNAGFGKSSLSTVIAGLCANTYFPNNPIEKIQKNAVSQIPIPWTFPLLIRLRHFFSESEKGKADKKGFLHYVYRRLKEYPTEECSYGRFCNYVSKQPQIYFILDGFDEVHTDDHNSFKECLQLITNLDFKSKVRVLITTRPATLQSLTDLVPSVIIGDTGSNHEVLSLVPLDDDLVMQTFNQFAISKFKDKEESLLRMFKKSFEALSGDLQAFLRVPLHVIMAVDVFESEGTLETDRFSFFQEFCSVIFKREAELSKTKGNKSKYAVPIKQNSRKLRIGHDELAFESYVSGRPPNITSASLNKVSTQLATDICEETHMQPCSQQDAEAEVKECITARLAMIKSRGDEYEFQVKSLCAYFAASHLFGLWDKKKKTGFDKLANDYDRWRDVIEFLVPRIFRRDGSDVRATIMKNLKPTCEDFTAWSGLDEMALHIFTEVNKNPKAPDADDRRRFLLQMCRSIRKCFLLNRYPTFSDVGSMRKYTQAFCSLVSKCKEDELVELKNMLFPFLEIGLAARAVTAWEFCLSYNEASMNQESSSTDPLGIEQLYSEHLPKAGIALNDIDAGLFADLALFHEVDVNDPFWQQFPHLARDGENKLDWSNVRYILKDFLNRNANEDIPNEETIWSAWQRVSAEYYENITGSSLEPDNSLQILTVPLPTLNFVRYHQGLRLKILPCKLPQSSEVKVVEGEFGKFHRLSPQFEAFSFGAKNIPEFATDSVNFLFG